MKGLKNLEEISKLVRYYILLSTTKAGSGHVTSSLSSVELMTVLMGGNFFKYDIKNPKNTDNDRIIFSKGHATPLLYALWVIFGKLNEKELLNLRTLKSNLQGHPTQDFKYNEVATGTLGQGLAIGLGNCLSNKYLDKKDCKTFVLLGDGEMSEGSNWEAIQLASYYKLNNLIGIIDVNKYEQDSKTILGYDLKTYKKRIQSFGWSAITINGHSINEIRKAYNKIEKMKKPLMIIAKTVKGKGISFLENKKGVHGKALNEKDFLKALKELGEIKKIRKKLTPPKKVKKVNINCEGVKQTLVYKKNELISTRKAYGHALIRTSLKNKDLIVLDAGVSNSTFSELFKKHCSKKFFNMKISEQAMVGAGIGFSNRGKIPFISTFSAFFSVAYAQLRMSELNNSNIKFVGSHCGVSIGKDGSSQMGLRDIGMFSSLLNSKIFYPCDAVSTEKLVQIASEVKGIFYIRTTRNDLPVIYDNKEKFKIGGSKVIKKSEKDKVTIIGLGITLHEALKSYNKLREEKIMVRVIDLYSIKPLDYLTLKKAVNETKKLIIVEDHYKEGGVGEQIFYELKDLKYDSIHLCVRRTPKSGSSENLLKYEKIDSNAIIKAVKKLLNK